MQGWHDRIPYRTGGLNMDKNYIIEKKILQSSTAHKKSVADLNIHVQERENLRTAWKKTEPEKRLL